MVKPSGRGTARQTFRADEELWQAYGAVVGDRSADLRRYMRYRVAHPELPLLAPWLDEGEQGADGGATSGGLGS